MRALEKILKSCVQPRISYNIRGWLTSVNDPNNLGSDLFGFQLNYDQVNSSIGGQARYDGSITQQIWATQANGKHAYGYSYDEMNQLLSAEYEKYVSGWNSDPGKYNESASYDLNGNIKTLNRYAGTIVDNLTFTLEGNRLLGSDDALANTTMALDFEDRGSTYSASNVEYVYDVNGNLIEDKNKKIKVRYNFMNLPVSVVFNNSGDSINWVYSTSGMKLRKIVYDDGVAIKTLDYVSGFDYTNGTLDFFYCEQGRVKKQPDGSLRHEYNLTDHLGNSRVFFTDANNDGTPEVIQESHYYAFGLRIEGLGVQNDNKYLYNGKELTDDFGLNWYEFGWRMYDAEIGRWHQVDPMDEFMSPYCYVGNDPINLIDPDGAQSGTDPILRPTGVWYQDKNGNVGQIFDWFVRPPDFEPGLQEDDVLFPLIFSLAGMGYQISKSIISGTLRRFVATEVVSTSTPVLARTERNLASQVGDDILKQSGQVSDDATQVAVQGSNNAVAVHTASKTASTKFGQLVQSLRDQLSGGEGAWDLISSHAEKATSKSKWYQGGISMEEVFINHSTGERIVRHVMYNNGELLYETFRPYAKFGQ